MATAKVVVKLSEQWQGNRFKCFNKQIGGRMFYFSTDRAKSERMAMALVAGWERLKTTGEKWNQENVSAALAIACVRKDQKERHATGHQRVHIAIDEYLADYRTGVSDSRYQRQRTALCDFKKRQPNVPLRMIGWNRLDEIVDAYRARPVTRHGSPMAVATIQTNLKAICAFFDWCDLSGRWESPRRFQRLFRLNYSSLRTPLEVKQDGLGAETYTLDELVTLWKSATARQRLYIGLALNIGETAQGIADLMKPDFQNDYRMIDRHRGKTGIRGVYPLWKEVTQLVRENVSTGSEPRAFLTMDGNQLVWYHDKGRVDSIAKTFANLLEKCPAVRRLGFAVLRKTGASMIRDLSGSVETAQTFLSHRGQTIAEKHYLSANYGRLAEALLAVRQHLEPMFNADQSSKTAIESAIAA